jgi:hypothetical protein
MKRIIIMCFLSLCLPFVCFSQWNNHYYFDCTVSYPWTSEFNDAVFLNSDTGYYCYTELPPNPSLGNNIIIKKTTNDCNTWNIDFVDSDMNEYSEALKYFYPYTYYVLNYQGMLEIYKKQEGGNWQYLTGTYGWFGDFFANNSNNYKILYNNPYGILLKYFENNIETKTDTFHTNTPSKIFYPNDTIGILLSDSFPFNFNNTKILRYIPSSGYSLVYQNKNQKLKDLYFTSNMIGYIAGDSGIVLHSTDLGISWTVLNTGFTSKINSMYFVNDSVGYIVGDSGLIIKTSNSGFSWQQQLSPINTNLNKIFFVNDSVGFILSGQVLLKTLNGGVQWINETLTTDNSVFTIFPNPSSDHLTLTLSQNITKASIKIYNLLGELKYTSTMSFPETTIDIADLAKGVYIVEVATERNVMREKFVKE